MVNFMLCLVSPFDHLGGTVVSQFDSWARVLPCCGGQRRAAGSQLGAREGAFGADASKGAADRDPAMEAALSERLAYRDTSTDAGRVGPQVTRRRDSTRGRSASSPAHGGPSSSSSTARRCVRCLRLRRVEDRPRAHRLPRRGRPALLLRPPRAGPMTARRPTDGPHRRVLLPRPARRQSRPVLAPGASHHRGGAHAREAPPDG